MRNTYNGSLTREQFLFYEIRTVAALLQQGLSRDETLEKVKTDLIARMRTDYVHEQQERYRTQLQMLEDSTNVASPAERIKINKQIAKLKEQADEIRQFEELLHHLADRMISINLDEGTKTNYSKFDKVLEKIK